MRVAYFADWELAELEHHGIDLVNVMLRRVRASGLTVPNTGTVPEGPHFAYEPTKDVFFGRHGRGPLVVVWDTNLLIDYFDHGRSLWAGESLPDILPSDQGDQLEALQMIMTLWVLRDIRFRILRGVLNDFKKPLAPERIARRRTAWVQFCSAISLVGDDDEWVGEPLSLPDSVLGSALKQVPAGKDRELVAAAVRERAHVFLTCDKDVLDAAPGLRPFGLRVADPQQLLEDLAAHGALHCILDPRRYLYWPIPDQQRVAHLILALPPQSTSV